MEFFSGDTGGMGALGRVRKILGAMKKRADNRLGGNSTFFSVFLKQLTFISPACMCGWVRQAVCQLSGACCIFSLLH